jgi:hypothetical protein
MKDFNLSFKDKCQLIWLILLGWKIKKPDLKLYRYDESFNAMNSNLKEAWDTQFFKLNE